mmetsp:Transcript_12061/g.24461  ORF Transcript_12061/g.24461 Transcript_12061/m.24461 type:complete len:187 (+) Transcript_12061:375-935(+)
MPDDRPRQEVSFWILVALLVGWIVLHASPYLYAVWLLTGKTQRRRWEPSTATTSTLPNSGSEHHLHQNDDDQPLFCLRLCGCCTLLCVFLCFFGIFAYGFPATLFIRGGEYCGGRHTRTNCQSAKNAGSSPILFVFPPYHLHVNLRQSRAIISWPRLPPHGYKNNWNPHGAANSMVMMTNAMASWP